MHKESIDIDLYWRDIARLIEAESDFGPVSDWNKSQVNIFLSKFLRKIEIICSTDKQKAKLCGLPYLNGELAQKPTISYYTFRRIFISKESSGSNISKEMFAIYFGYNSFEDYFKQKKIFKNGHQFNKTLLRQEDENSLYPISLKKVVIVIGLLALVVLSYFIVYNRSLLASKDYAFVRNDNGIAVVDLFRQRTKQAISDMPYLTGVTYDEDEQMLFWANSDSNYRCLGVAKFYGVNKVEIINTRLTERIGYPAGISLDREQKKIYCADYTNSVIKAFSFDGEQLFEYVLPSGTKPSSVLFDNERKCLYFTSIGCSSIGRIDIDSDTILLDFIENVGTYPDGLTLNSHDGILFWASNSSRQIGWKELGSNAQSTREIEYPVTALEFNDQKEVLYASIWNTNEIKLVYFDPSNSDNPFRFSQLVYDAGGTSPGVIKIFRDN